MSWAHIFLDVRSSFASAWMQVAMRRDAVDEAILMECFAAQGAGPEGLAQLANDCAYAEEWADAPPHSHAYVSAVARQPWTTVERSAQIVAPKRGVAARVPTAYLMCASIVSVSAKRARRRLLAEGLGVRAEWARLGLLGIDAPDTTEQCEWVA